MSDIISSEIIEYFWKTNIKEIESIPNIEYNRNILKEVLSYIIKFPDIYPYLSVQDTPFNFFFVWTLKYPDEHMKSFKFKYRNEKIFFFI